MEHAFDQQFDVDSFELMDFPDKHAESDLDTWRDTERLAKSVTYRFSISEPEPVTGSSSATGGGIA